MGFKVIETEEELRSAHSAGLLWYRYTNHSEYAREFLDDVDYLVSEWRWKEGWESYVLVEDE